MEQRQLTCIGCPMGCPITVTMENGQIQSIEGFTCKRGETFYYRANTTHTISNAGKTIAKLLWISTPPNF